MTDRLIPPVPPLAYAMDGTLELPEGLQGHGEGSAPCNPFGGSTVQLDLLKTNASLNSFMTGRSEVLVRELHFGDVKAASEVVELLGPFDLILGSDVAYNREAHAALAGCLAHLHACCRSLTLAQGASKSSGPEMLLAFEKRLSGCEDSLRETLLGQGLGATVIHRERSFEVWSVKPL